MSRPPLDTFQIGWICALPIEAAAAAEMLDEEFGILDEQDTADTNTYTLGRIGKHHVVIACLPGGQYGTTSATTVANNMIRTFSKSLRIGLMVGIGGGIPSADHDIRLGDVVISYSQGTCGGVIQYDMGKIVAGGVFERTGSLSSPPRAILTAVSTMRAAALRDDPRYLEYLESAIVRTARTRKNFGRPALQCDRLFKAKHDHPTSARSCDGCLAEWEETRSEREDSNPQPHYGIIASGNCVIKYGETREQLRVTTGALCFEMEAAGLISDFPCIIVRGVCDYADSHKNKQWQGYAALAAALYTKELLQYVPVSCVSQEKLVVDVCNELKEEIRGTNQYLNEIKIQQDQHYREQIEMVLSGQQRDCYQALKVASYEEQKNINPRRVEGTCFWALQSPEYIRWSESTFHDLLWISADPGCGKSVLARSIIDDYLATASQEVTVCYFFFKDNEEQNYLAAAMCLVLHQLFSQRPDLLRYAMPSWDKNGGKLRYEAEELWRIFITAALAGAWGKTVCIFDALDECREVDQGRLIGKLDLFQRQSSLTTQAACLKFLVTSRPYDRIQNHFRFPHLHLKGEEDNDQIYREIDIVVKLRVKDLAETARLSHDVTQRLEQHLLEMEHRTYLWLYLAMDDIRSIFEDSLRPAEESIRMVTPLVNEAYERILNRVPSEHLNTVRKALQIIVAARRPLTTVEMAMALGIAIFLQSRTAAEAGIDLSLICKKLRRLCGLFVFVNNSKIYLIHQTAKEFLITKSNSNYVSLVYLWRLSEAENQMAGVCLQYLLMKDLVYYDEGISANIFGFLDYSAVFWPDHVRKMDLILNEKAIERVHQLYDTSGKIFSLWFPFFWKVVRPYDNVPKMQALYLAVFNGYYEEIQSQLGLHDCYNWNINSPDDTGTHAVVWALLNGHKRVVQTLLDHEANVNAQGGLYGNALQAACSNGHNETVQLLTVRGADVNARGGLYANALQAACSKGHNETVQLLLECGADVNALGGEYGSALQAVCSKGHNEVVQLLLERGADVNARGGLYANALQAACSKGHNETVQLLLEHGADVNARGGEYGYTLQAACSKGYNEIVQLLLEHGADVNAQARGIGNALQTACSKGHIEVVQLLLQRDANVNAQGGWYGNALQAACSERHNEIVQILLERGADVNAQGGEYGNALQAACLQGENETVQLLLERGADVNAQSGEYGNALQAACSKGHNEIVQLLLERGADVNAQGGWYGNALHAACSKGHNEIVQLLLERGADVNALDGRYGNAFHAACSEGHSEIVQLLLEHGADVNAQARGYGNVLQAACSEGHSEIVQLLLERGADVNAQGGLYANALQVACCKWHNEIVQLLLERGANVNAQAREYGNAPQAACYNGQNKIVQLLLEHGPDVKAQGGLYGNARQAACSDEDKDIRGEIATVRR